MLKKQIRVGGHYLAKVSNKVVVVKVDSIDGFTLRGRETVRYEVTNLSTGRHTTFRSASKFRDEVPVCDKCGKPFTRFRGDKPNTCLPCLGQPQEGRGMGEDRPTPRTVADVNRDQAEEMEKAIGPVPPMVGIGALKHIPQSSAEHRTSEPDETRQYVSGGGPGSVGEVADEMYKKHYTNEKRGTTTYSIRAEEFPAVIAWLNRYHAEKASDWRTESLPGSAWVIMTAQRSLLNMVIAFIDGRRSSLSK